MRWSVFYIGEIKIGNDQWELLKTNWDWIKSDTDGIFSDISDFFSLWK